MMKPEHKAAPAPSATEFAKWDDVAEIDSTGFELRGNLFYCWCRLRDGRDALWEFDLRAPPGQDQRLKVIRGT